MTHSVLNKDFFCGETVCATLYVEGYVLTNTKSETVMQPKLLSYRIPSCLLKYTLIGWFLALPQNHQG